MSMPTNETLEFAILEDGYKPTEEEIKKLAKELWDLKHIKENEK
jgi:hypothetical protein